MHQLPPVPDRPLGVRRWVRPRSAAVTALARQQRLPAWYRGFGGSASVSAEAPLTGPR